MAILKTIDEAFDRIGPTLLACVTLAAASNNIWPFMDEDATLYLNIALLAVAIGQMVGLWWPRQAFKGRKEVGIQHGPSRVQHGPARVQLDPARRQLEMDFLREMSAQRSEPSAEELLIPWSIFEHNINSYYGSN